MGPRPDVYITVLTQGHRISTRLLNLIRFTFINSDRSNEITRRCSTLLTDLIPHVFVTALSLCLQIKMLPWMKNCSMLHGGSISPSRRSKCFRADLLCDVICSVSSQRKPMRWRVMFAITIKTQKAFLPKLWEGNVFTRVCLSFCSGGY